MATAFFVLINVNMLPIVKQDGWRLQVAQTKLSTHFPLVKIAFELFGSDHAGVCFGLAKC